MSTLSTDRATHVGAVLESIVALSRALASPRMTPFGDAVLTRTQLEILFVLAHDTEPVTPGRLAARLKLTGGAITQTMDQLRDHGLVEQSFSDSDGRVRVWRLTATAIARVTEFETAAVTRIAPRFEALTTGELDQLATLLSRIEPS